MPDMRKNDSRISVQTSLLARVNRITNLVESTLKQTEKQRNRTGRKMEHDLNYALK